MQFAARWVDVEWGLTVACTKGVDDVGYTETDAVVDSDTEPQVLAFACGTTDQVGTADASQEKNGANPYISLGDGDVPRLDILMDPDDFAVMQDD